VVDPEAVRRYVVANVGEHPQGLTRLVAQHFSISRQAANRHIARLVSDGVLHAEGETRSRKYHLAVLANLDETIAITPELEEHALWEEYVLPLLGSTPATVRDICNYGFTEMVNNAKDHSGSAEVWITAQVTAATVHMTVNDEGVGIFKKIRTALGLDDDRHAILELVKGKVTTDPARHTGEGIFFTSRMFDYFGMTSGRLFLGRMRQTKDYLIEAAEPMTGTRVAMTIATSSDHTTNEVFERYATDQDDYAFQRTHVVVSLSQSEGEKLVSRSQAKRIVARLDRFKEVLLDFKGIDSIGPAFADEVFRVFRSTHPDVHLVVTNDNDEVRKMIRRAESAAAG
jgi:anti-sigma regulatory factor (Ser/Thr protein kinase)